MRGARLVAAIAMAVAVAGVSVVHAQQAASPVVPASRDTTNDLRRRTPEQRLQRTRSAMQRALFSSDEQIPVTLIADFKAVNRDRNVESTRVFPATIVAPALNGGEDRIAVNVRTRGHSRRATGTCTFAPLRVEFTSMASSTRVRSCTTPATDRVTAVCASTGDPSSSPTASS